VSLASERAERDLVRLCHGGLDLPALRTRVLRSLRRLMPVDAAFLATADPETLLFTSAYSEEPLAAATPLFLDNEFRDADVNKFTELATASTHVSSLDAATRGDRRSSGRYRDIMRPAGLGDELRAALTTGQDCWGYLCLHRTDHPLGFTAAEAAIVARVGPHIAHALRQSVLLHDNWDVWQVPVSAGQAVNLTGNNKYVKLQGAPMVVRGGIPAEPGEQTSDRIFSPVMLTN